jgi:hypothetical protein
LKLVEFLLIIKYSHEKPHRRLTTSIEHVAIKLVEIPQIVEQTGPTTDLVKKFCLPSVEEPQIKSRVVANW